MKIDWAKVKEGFTLTDVLKEENKELKQEIERLNKENEDLKAITNIEMAKSEYYENIINELEKRLEQGIEDNKKEYSLKSQMAVFVLRDVLELIEELKGEDKE